VFSVGPVVSTVIVDVVTHSLRLLEIFNIQYPIDFVVVFSLFTRYLFSIPSLMATRQLETAIIREKRRYV